MPKNLTAAMRAHLDAETTRLAAIWRITRKDTEEYELEILDGPGGAVLRTETGITTTSFTYTSGMQSADFGGAQTELSFVVYQISAQVGRGFPGERTVEILP
jgi:hypothetical protein